VGQESHALRQESVPAQVREYAEQAVAYVRSALQLDLTYDSDTLPLLDFYLRNVPRDQVATVHLVVSTAGPYFGEVVRLHLGGRWEMEGEDPIAWRVVLPTGLSLAPAGIVAAVIAESDDIEDVDTGFDAPPGVWPHLEAALGRMSQVTEEEYYSLCGRFDTLEHVQDVLLAIAAAKLGSRDF
jgi:hypothetical protein